MKIRGLIFSILLVGSCFHGFSQVKFNRAYDRDSSWEGASAVVQTIDGGYFIAGEALDGKDGIYVVKTDANGDTLWTKLLGTTLDSAVTLSSIGSCICLVDGGFVIAGTANTNKKYDAFLLKLNKYGNVQWLHYYGGIDNDYGDGVIASSDGGFMLLASGYSFSNGD